MKRMPIHLMRNYEIVAVFICFGLLSACSTSVIVSAEFPEPLVEPLPLKVGLHYSEALTGYTYTEVLPANGTWSFDLGEANTKLFDSVFLTLFETTTQVDTIDAAEQQFSHLDAVIEPAIEAFEFSLPHQSRSDQYAVWIRYNLKVYSSEGELITAWLISAYGQSDSKLFGADDSMEQATIMAMRDAAAMIILGFAKEPEIKKALFKVENDEES